MDREARSIISSAREEADKSIKHLREEAASEIEAIQRTTDLVEKQRGADNASVINSLMIENEKEKASKLAALRGLVNRNYEKAVEVGLELLDKTN